MPTRRSRLLALNDPRLGAYLAAHDDRDRAEELERLLVAEVHPRVREVLASYRQSGWPIDAADSDDLSSHITLRILQKLRAATVLEEESVQNLEAYVTTLTKNAVRDVMRRRSPVRTRLKSRLRYLFTRDPRVALWLVEGVTFCGLASWANRTDIEMSVERIAAAAGAVPAEQMSPDDIVRCIEAIGIPVRLSDLVSALSTSPVANEPSAERATSDGDPVEARQYLSVLWTEIRALPPKQQSALLLNLRDPSSGNAIVLFLTLGIATLNEVADAAGMTAAGLAAIWDDLPLEDLRIATQLGMTRQQVINLRKSARERLSRRMLKQGHVSGHKG
jgi:hypothetical protein